MLQSLILLTIVTLLLTTVLCLRSCELDILQTLDDNQVAYTFEQNIVLIEYEQAVSFSLELENCQISTKIVISDIDKLEIKQFNIVNSTFDDNLTFLNITNSTDVVISNLNLQNITYDFKSLILSVKEVINLNVDLFSLKEIVNEFQVSESNFISFNARQIMVQKMLIYNYFANYLSFNGSYSVEINNFELASAKQVFKIYTYTTFNILSNNIKVSHIDISEKDYTIHSSQNCYHIFIIAMTLTDNLDNISKKQIKIDSIFADFKQSNQSYSYSIQLEDGTENKRGAELLVNQLIYNSEEPNNAKQFLLHISNIESITFLTISLNNYLNSLIQLSECKNISFGSFLYRSNQVSSNKIPLEDGLITSTYMEFVVIESLTVQNIRVQRSPLLLFLNIQSLRINAITIENCVVETNLFRFASVVINISNTHIVSTKVLYDLLNIINCDELSITKFEFSSYPSLNQLQQDRSVAVSNLPQNTFYLFKLQMIKKYYQDEVFVDLFDSSLGFMELIQFDKASIVNSIIQGGYSLDKGGCINFDNTEFYEKYLSLFTLINSHFINCTSELFGGAIFGGQLERSLYSSFTNCTSSIGGALYISNNSNISSLVDEIQFTDNEGLIADNNYSFGISEIGITSVRSYSPHLSDTLFYLKEVKIDSKQNSYRFLNGMVYVLELNMKILGQGQILQLQKSKLRMNMINYLVQQGYLNIANTQITHIESPYVAFSVMNQKSSDLVIPQKVIFKILRGINLNVQFSFVDGCDEGMEYVEIYSYNTYSCRYCQITQCHYGLDYSTKEVSNQLCQNCNLELFEICYANISTLREGHWRSVYSINEDNIFSCDIAYQNCQGGAGIENELCYEGHSGPQCLDCDLYGTYWNSSYSRFGQFQCTQCDSISQNTLKLIIILLILYISIIIIIIQNYKGMMNQIRSIYLSKLGIVYIGSSLQRRSLASVYIKILVFNFSIYSISSSFTRVDIIFTLRQFSFTISNPINSQMFSVDCLLKDLNYSQENIGFLNLILSVLIPTVLVLLALVFLATAYFCKRIKLQQIKYGIILTLQYTFVILFYSQILKLNLESFACLNLDRGKSFSLLDLTLECGTEAYDKLKSLSIPIFIILNVITPLYLFFSLFLKQRKLQKIRIMLTYGFLYKEYKPQFYFWEFIRFQIKALLLCLSITLIQYPLAFCILIAIILMIYLIVLIKYQPFNTNILNKLEQISIFLSIFNLTSSLAFEEFNDNKNSGIELLVKTQYILSFVLSFLFIILLIFLIIISFFEKLIRKIQIRFNLKWLDRWFPQYTFKLYSNFKKFRTCVFSIINHLNRQELELNTINKTSKQSTDSNSVLEQNNNLYETSEQNNNFDQIQEQNNSFNSIQEQNNGSNQISEYKNDQILLISNQQQ